MSVCPGCGLAVGPEATLAPGGLLHCEVCGRVFPIIPPPATDEDPITATTPAAKNPPAPLPLDVAPSPSGPTGLIRLKLNIVRGPATGRTIDVQGQEITFGRSKGDVQIIDPEISRQHLSFQSVASRCLVRDLRPVTLDEAHIVGSGIQAQLAKPGGVENLSFW